MGDKSPKSKEKSKKQDKVQKTQESRKKAADFAKCPPRSGHSGQEEVAGRPYCPSSPGNTGNGTIDRNSRYSGAAASVRPASRWVPMVCRSRPLRMYPRMSGPQAARYGSSAGGTAADRSSCRRTSSSPLSHET